MKSKYITISILIVITAIVFFSYLPTLKNGFVNLDDDKYIINNNLIKDLTWKNIISVFDYTDFEAYQENSFAKFTYFPVTLISFSIEYHFYKLSAIVFHSTNLVLHILNCLLVFWMIVLLTHNISVSFITSILFGVHPLHVESVAWISERKDVLYSMFFLFSIISYIYYLKRRSWPFYLFSVLFFLLSMLSKTMAITLPLILLLIHFTMEKNIKISIIFKMLPFFIIVFFMIFLISINVKLGYYFGMSVVIQNFTVFNLIREISYGILFYIGKIILPVKLSCIYKYPDQPNNIYFQIFVLSAMIASFFFTAVFLIARSFKELSFGMLFFLITVFPVLHTVSSDRFTYIPSIGIFIIFGTVVIYVYNNFISSKDWYLKAFFNLVIFMLIVILSIMTFERCKVWKNDETLMTDIIKNYNNIYSAYYNRAVYFSKKGDYQKALNDFDETLKLSPSNYKAYINRGIVYGILGKDNLAIMDFQRASEIYPRDENIYVNRGISFYRLGEYKNALNDFARALRLKPGFIEALVNRGLVFLMIKDYEKAINDYSEILKIKPNMIEALINRGIVYNIKGEYDEAIDDYNVVLSINPHLPQIYNNRGIIYFKRGEYEKALIDFTMAINKNPVYKEAYKNRYVTYMKTGNLKRAQEDRKRLIDMGVTINK